MINYFDVLDVRVDASQDEVMRAFQTLAKIYHPDRLPPKEKLRYNELSNKQKNEVLSQKEEEEFSELGRKFQNLNDAFRCLNNPDSRDEHISDLKPEFFKKLLHTIRGRRLKEVSCLLKSLGCVARKIIRMVDEKNNNWTAMHYAAELGNLEIVKILKCEGAPIDAGEIYEELQINKKKHHQPVHIATLNGHRLLVEYFLSQGINVNECGCYNSTPLHIASAAGNLRIVKFLVDRNACITGRDTYGDMPIHVAVKNSHKHIVDFFFADGQSIDDRGSRNDTMLYMAARNGDFVLSSFLIEEGADVNFCVGFSETAIHVAAANGHNKILGLLLQNGANVNEQRFNLPPLYRAVENGHLETVRFLINNGANVSDNDNETLLGIAWEKGYSLIVDLLMGKGRVIEKLSLHHAIKICDMKVVNSYLKKGADVNDIDSEGYRPLHYAVESGNIQLVKSLVDEGADVLARNDHCTVLHLAVSSNEVEVIKLILNEIKMMGESSMKHIDAQDTQGDTPLMWAARSGNEIATSLLVKYGTNVFVNDKGGLTALHLAARSGHLGIVKLLVNAGAEVDAADYICGRKPIDFAIIGGHTVIVEFLGDRGASLKNADNRGWTPLHYAARYGRLRNVKYLIERGADVVAETKSKKSPIELARDGLRCFKNGMKRALSDDVLEYSPNAAYFSVMSHLEVAIASEVARREDRPLIHL